MGLKPRNSGDENWQLFGQLLKNWATFHSGARNLTEEDELG